MTSGGFSLRGSAAAARPGGFAPWALAGLLVAAAVAQGWALMRAQPPGIDFLPLWTAGRMAWSDPSHVYDFAAVTRAQAWLLPHFGWMRPYAYPPSALVLLEPLGRLPFWPALGVWTALGLGPFLYASFRLAASNRAIAAVLAAASPAVVIAASAGQMALLEGGLLTLAVIELKPRPRLAGVLFGIVAALKPQAAILAPVALAACGAAESLIAAGATLAAVGAASALMFGAGRWGEWFASLPAFQRVVEGVPALGSAIITPLWAARELGLSGPLAAVWAGAFAIGGAWLVWRAFRSGSSLAGRAGALAVGSLMCAPYAMSYDAALIAPAAAALALAGLRAGRTLPSALAFVGALAITAPHLGLAGLAVFAALVFIDAPTPEVVVEEPAPLATI